ncbi:ABC transporter ATP-binding protein [Teredinibacter purpureus]|uniref:ABC transporter ATP-binding protein n=1 Tax=Teredinibacter purpureus TaxID=2731756 RepID=UPI0005F7AF5A|nr:ABC transporter ATP-binding protein [Teredinibacter purpureus]
MIHANNIGRRYGEFTAVGNVSFDIQAGEIVGLLGHNGAGKTTIMKMLTGYIEPSTGSITINSVPLSENTDELQQLIGYLPENLPVYPEMTVMDYLYYCAQMRNIEPLQLDEHVAVAIQKTELASKALNPISTLSRGFKQRVGVAQALIHNPKILILDEPTNGLDPHQTQQMRTLIRTLATHATVIISTHIMQEVDALCDRVLILDSGGLAVDQSMEELRRSNIIALNTNANLAAVNASLASYYLDNQLVDSAAAALIKTLDNINTYHIPVGESANTAELCNGIIQDLIANKYRIFAIHPLMRDLESVFRRIHLNNKTATQNEASHAV